MKFGTLIRFPAYDVTWVENRIYVYAYKTSFHLILRVKEYNLIEISPSPVIADNHDEEGIKKKEDTRDVVYRVDQFEAKWRLA